MNMPNQFPYNYVPMPAGIILVQAINFAISKGMPKPVTLEEQLRVKDRYVAEASVLN